MDTISVTRPIVWKAIVTDKFKAEMHQELERAKVRLDMEIQQLEFQAKRVLPDLERQNLRRAMAVRQELEDEKQKRVASIERLSDQIRELQELTNGEEIARGTLEGLAQVSIGDDITKILYAEIVTKDDLVVELREGRQAP